MEGEHGAGHHEEPPVEEASAGPHPTSGHRFRGPHIRQPTLQELDNLPVEKRLELLNQRRQSRHQTLNSLGIMFGVLFTLASLAATALTLRAGQEELRTAQQGQITDRYTKAIEQLGSGKPEVRLGGIYALERLLTDSARDRRTILEVLASYVRVHAQDRPPVGSDKTRLAVDAQAALTVIGRNYQARKKENFRLDLANVDLHRKNLNSMRLTGADLTGADLTDTILIRANLAGAVLYTADLTGAYLIGANLTGTGLSGNLTGAFLADADLRGAYLIRADLKDADLRGADLRGAYLIDPDLKDADLRGADLRGMQGTAAEMVKRAAKTDATTRFV